MPSGSWILRNFARINHDTIIALTMHTPPDLALQMYKAQFANLNRNINKHKQLAPHKPILLLAIMEQVEAGRLTSSRIELTDDLVRRFKMLWDKHVPHGIQFNPDVTKPYYHMSAEPFWTLLTHEQDEIEQHLVAEDCNDRSSKALPKPRYSVKAMREDFACAYIDHTLFLLMKDHDSRCELRNVLYKLLLRTHDDFDTTTTPHVSIRTGKLVLNGDIVAGKKVIKKAVA